MLDSTGRANIQISVVCPVHNTEPWMLRAAIRSLLDQEGSEVLEVVIVDDASKREDTHAALREVEMEPRVRVIRSDRNLGPGGARNVGIRAATGSRIGFIDADDLWPPGSLAARLAAPAGADDVLLGNFLDLFEGDRTAPSDELPLSETGEHLGEGWYAWNKQSAAETMIASWRHLGTLLVPKAALEEIGLFDEELKYGEDWIIVVRLAATRRIVAKNQPLYLLRRQHESLMTSFARLTPAFFAAQVKAYRDRGLRRHRRHLRWALLRQHRNMAVNSLANGRRWNAVRCGLRAWMMDPREVRPIVNLVRAAVIKDPALREAAARRYSTAVVTRLN